MATEDNNKDNRKQSLYFPAEVLQDMKEQAARLDRSLSWLIKRAWSLSRAEILKMQSVTDD